MEQVTISSKLLQPSQQSYYGQNFNTVALQKDPKKVGGFFEAMFYRMIFDQMHQSDEEDPLLSDFSSKQIRDMQDDEIANLLGAQGKLGLSQMVTKAIEKAEDKNVVQLHDLDKVFNQGILKSPKEEKKLC